MTQHFRDKLVGYKIMPVLTVQSVEQAIATCQALQAGGINAVEITLRTDAAWDAIAAVKGSLQNFDVGVGTVKSAADLDRLAKIGVAFAVSPGLTPAISKAARANDIDLLPGVSTASEILMGMELGHSEFKLFPAQAVGGVSLLKSLASPFSEICFCPTGGINLNNLSDYLSLPNVVCVGGSWMVSEKLIDDGDWETVTRLSRECIEIIKGISA